MSVDTKSDRTSKQIVGMRKYDEYMNMCLEYFGLTVQELFAHLVL